MITTLSDSTINAMAIPRACGSLQGVTILLCDCAQLEPVQWLGLFLRVLIGLGCGVLGCCVFKPGGADRLDAYGTGGTCGFDAFSAQAMVHGWDHPCRHEKKSVAFGSRLYRLKPRGTG